MFTAYVSMPEGHKQMTSTRQYNISYNDNIGMYIKMWSVLW